MLTNKSYGKRMMPEYLINFVRDIYEGPVPLSFGRSLVKEANIKKLETYYKLFKGTAKKNYGERMVPNYLLKYIEKLANADYVEYVDDLVAYIKETPQKALKYGFINKVGGMSYKSENLIQKYEQGTYLNQTINNRIAYCFGSQAQTITIKCFDDNFQYIIQTFEKGTRNYITTIIGWINSTQTITTNGIDDYVIVVAYTDSSQINPNTETNVMAVKGSTAPTEFKQGFEGIRDSAVTSVNDFTIASEIQALEGYGWGINNTCNNYIDYDTKKFIQKVDRIDLGSLNWQKSSSGDNRFFATVPVQYKFVENVAALCSIYDYGGTASGSEQYYTDDKTFKLFYASTAQTPPPREIYVVDTSYNDAEDFKTAMSGVYLYLEIETPVETVISDYIKDNIIDVSSGELKFNNEYEQAVPSEVTYYVEA